ncbi:hypothetical protein ACWGJ2_39575 [Streptomyces sp. NPDC054796]
MTTREKVIMTMPTMPKTFLSQLVQERGWSEHAAFTIHFERAAQELAKQTGEPELAAITVSRRTFERWLGGSNRPNPDARRVLHHLFEAPADKLLGPAESTAARKLERSGLLPSVGPVNTSVDVGPESTSVDPALVPHWGNMLHILSAAHNAFGPMHMYTTVTRELDVIRSCRHSAERGVRRGLLGVEARWAEFASWSAETLGRRSDATYWLMHSRDLAREAADDSLEAYVLMRLAQQATERRDAHAARDLAEAAWEAARGGERDRALCAVRLAHGYALAGDDRSSARVLKTAHQLVDQADQFACDDDPATIGHHCVRAYVQAHEAYCHLLLGHARQAVVLLHEAIDGWPSEYRQDVQLARAWLALAYAADGRVPEAAVEGATALALTTSGGSVRVLRVLRSLDRRLPAQAGSHSEVAQFRSALALTSARM